MITWPQSPMLPPPIARRSTPRAASASARVAIAPGSFFSWTTNWLAIDASASGAPGPRRRSHRSGRRPGDAPVARRAPDGLRYRRAMTIAPTDRRPARLAAVVAALDDADADRASGSTIEAAGIPFSALAWGDPGAGRCPDPRRDRVRAGSGGGSGRRWPRRAGGSSRVDQAGHGQTGHWQGHHRFRDNAADVAAFDPGGRAATSRRSRSSATAGAR